MLLRRSFHHEYQSAVMVDSPKRWKLIKISREKLRGVQTVTVYLCCAAQLLHNMVAHCV